MTDIAEFKKLSWTFLTNIKFQWEYDGIAYAFRKKNIPLYGKDLGSKKENHPLMALVTNPFKEDEFYGVDLYVPVDRLKEAKSIIHDEEKIKAFAELEKEKGQEYYAAFDEEVARKKAEKSQSGLLGSMRSIFSRPQSE